MVDNAVDFVPEARHEVPKLNGLVKAVIANLADFRQRSAGGTREAAAESREKIRCIAQESADHPARP
jgi:hypothetical protein